MKSEQIITIIVVLAAILFFNGYGMMGSGGMHGFYGGFGMGIFGGIFMALVLIALILLIIWLIKQLQEPYRRHKK